MKKIFILITLLPFLVSFAQSGSIKGKVITSENEPLINANVVIIGTQQGAATSPDGFFEISNVQFGEYSLEVSLIGYGKKTISLAFDAKTKPITIILIEEAIQSEQIIVSAGKYQQKVQDLSVSTAILTPDNISKKNYLTFDDALRFVPGVQMNLEQVSIRGSNGYSKGVGARVLVAANGIPLYSGDTGDIVWELIPVADIERVEIIKGPASSLYGSTAIGGVINIITKSSVKNPVTHFSSYIGAYDKPTYDIWKWNNNTRYFYGVELTHSNSVNNLSYTLSLKKFDNMGYRQNDYTKRNLGYLKLNYDFTSQNHLLFFADFLNMNRGNFLYWKDSRNALVPKDEDNGNTVKSNRLFTGLIYHHTFNKDITAEFKSSFYHTKFDGYGIELTTSKADLFRNELLANINLSDSFVLTPGIETSYSKISSNIFKSPDFFGFGAYTQGVIKINPDLSLTLGLRFDYMKLDTLKSANAVAPKAGLNYKLTKDFILRTSLGTGFRAPTPSEVFTTAAIGGGIDVKSNPDLKAETSISFEIGAVYNYSKNLLFDLAFYQNEYKDFIEPVLTQEAKIQFTNLSRARIQGVELNSDWTLIPGELKLKAGYNYMWARDLEKNIAMKYRPRNSVSAQLQYSPYPFEFGIDFRYMSKVEEIDFNLTQPPIALVIDGDKRVPVYVTDLNIGYNFLFGSIPAKIFINAKNIFNYNCVEFIGNVAPIRNYSFSFEIFF
ncbi:MAG: TonB-dependent receptor [Ignavibacteriales bacterium]|nr:TonB-dependent receptor [Ignavibacteriales bacterium]